MGACRRRLTPHCLPHVCLQASGYGLRHGIAHLCHVVADEVALRRSRLSQSLPPMALGGARMRFNASGVVLGGVAALEARLLDLGCWEEAYRRGGC